ncbi:MAG: hypothetical protein AAB507_01425 [Patescibacteria group bacterium]
MSQIEPLLKKEIAPGVFPVSPVARSRHKGEEFYIHGFLSEDSEEHPETLALSKRKDAMGEWKYIPYQEVELLV